MTKFIDPAEQYRAALEYAKRHRREEDEPTSALADLERRRTDFRVYPERAAKTFRLGDRVLVRNGDYPGVTGTVVSVPGAGHALYGVLPDAVREKLQNMSPKDRAFAPSGILGASAEGLELIPPDESQVPVSDARSSTRA